MLKKIDGGDNLGMYMTVSVLYVHLSFQTDIESIKAANDWEHIYICKFNGFSRVPNKNMNEYLN